ncbi:MAG: rhodanese-like domain-containing protein, partial [Endozoicomonas sp.]
NHPVHVGALAVLIIALIITEKRKGGQSISSAELTRLVNKEFGVVLDVREKADYAKGHIVNAINIPFAKIKGHTGELDKYRDKIIIVVDAMGQHSGSVGKELKAAGFTQVVRLSGGMNTWTSDSLPVVKG